MSFWDIIWFIVVSFAFIAYLMIMFNIVGDLFRDGTVSGGMKAVWILCLVVFPFVTALVYLVVRGEGMARRQVDVQESVQDEQDAYIRSVAGASPAEQIARAQSLLAAGALDQAEFETLKAKALA